MKRIIIMLLLCLSGCQTGGLWTSAELKDWYVRLSEPEPRFLSPLYYQGTDERFHYFTCRSMDTWVPVKVQKEEIEIDDIRPYKGLTSTAPFPGYYAVDPKESFKKTEDDKNTR